MREDGQVLRMKESVGTNAEIGQVSWSPAKSIWFFFHCLLAFVGFTIYFSISGFIVFIFFTAITLCLGHSLGMHRRLIHNSYDCPLWMEYFFVHLGVLVGMTGPMGMIYQHDLRDWAQRKKDCHSYLRHGENFLKDGWWQLNCDLHLEHPPVFACEDRVKNDDIYQVMEKFWMAQQIPWALLLFYCGGISWVLLGISARIAISSIGHWLIGYFAHNSGERDWDVDGAAVQGHNVRFSGLITMGESWHNNHHAFPGSAMLGIYNGQADPGWWVLNKLMNLGLVKNVKLPSDLKPREELSRISSSKEIKKSFKNPKHCPLLQKITS